MPPRTVKRGGAASGTRRTPRTTKKTQSQQPEASPLVEEPVKAEETAQDAEVTEEAEPTIEDKPVEEKPVIDEKQAEEERSEPQVTAANGSVPVTKEDGPKEPVDEYGRDEQLDLDDNDPEYEPEEYDDKDLEQEDVDYAGLHGELQHDDQIVEDELEEEETDLVEEELDEGQEELDVEEEEEEDDHHDRAAEGREHEHPDLDAEAEHHEVFKERRKRKEFEVFVGGLDNKATEDDLRKVFSAVGEITEVRLMMNSQTKRNKGFAFLRFATIEQAKRAVAELKHPVINGKECGVAPSQDSDTLFLGNICKTWTKEALREKLKHYGVDNIDDVTLVEDSNSEGMNRGFAFLEFSSRSDAKDAFKRLQKRDISFGVDRPAKVSFADSFIDPGDEIMAQVKTVFIDSLPASWDEDRVRELLKKYGIIEKIELARNMQHAKRRDFGFVTFDTHEAAVVCAKSINNAEIGDGDSKAKVRARLSRPLQKGKGKQISRGDMRSSRGSRIPGGSYRRLPPPPPPRSYPSRPIRRIGSRMPSNIVRRPVAVRDRRLVAVPPPPRARPLPPPTRYYDRRPPVPSYPKGSMKRDYDRREEMPPPRSRAPPVDYGPRAMPERRVSYREEYQTRGSGYADMPRSAPRSMARREYPDDGYDHRFDRSTSYRESRTRDYDSVPGSKRPYSAMDDVPPRYADPGPRQSRARLDYDIGSSHHQYSDGYGDRMGRSNMYSGSRSSMNNQDSHGMYSSRSMGYNGGGSYNSGDVGGMYSSSYGSDYISRGSNGGSGSYSSSMYSSRGAGGSSSYMGPGGGSGSYY